MNGIEAIVDIHWDNLGQSWGVKHLHTWNGSAWTTNANVVTPQTTENGGKTIELAVPKANLGDAPWTMHVGVQDSVNDDTSDYTSSAMTPEPATLALLAMGVLGVLRRRRA